MMKHNIFSITVMPNEKGIYLKVTSDDGANINMSGSFDQIYPILDTLVLGMRNGEDDIMEYVQ